MQHTGKTVAVAAAMAMVAIGSGQAVAAPADSPAAVSSAGSKTPAWSSLELQQAQGQAVVRAVWVVAREGLNQRTDATTASQRRGGFAYGQRLLVTDGVRQGQDPYGTGQAGWYALADGSGFVWAGGVAETAPPVAAAVRPAPKAKPVSKPAAPAKKKAPAKKRAAVQPAPGAGGGWAALRQCESGGNYAAVSPNGRYRGAYQFDRRTWQSVGGSGDPAQASPAEQDMRAQMLYNQRGRSPWPVCGRRM